MIPERVDKFLAFSEYKVLEGYEKISRQQAEKKRLQSTKNLTKHNNLNPTLIKEPRHFLNAQRNQRSGQ